jgi:hypothetical protein
MLPSPVWRKPTEFGPPPRDMDRLDDLAFHIRNLKFGEFVEFAEQGCGMKQLEAKERLEAMNKLNKWAQERHP